MDNNQPNKKYTQSEIEKALSTIHHALIDILCGEQLYSQHKKEHLFSLVSKYNSYANTLYYYDIEMYKTNNITLSDGQKAAFVPYNLGIAFKYNNKGETDNLSSSDIYANSDLKWKYDVVGKAVKTLCNYAPERFLQSYIEPMEKQKPSILKKLNTVEIPHVKPQISTKHNAKNNIEL